MGKITKVLTKEMEDAVLNEFHSSLEDAGIEPSEKTDKEFLRYLEDDFWQWVSDNIDSWIEDNGGD